jgi:hypothetical protein
MTIQEQTGPAHLPKSETEGQRIALRVVRVVLMLDVCRIEGSIHLPPELTRFSDAWESVMRDPRMFFPVTGTKLRYGDDSQLLYAPEFMQVRKTEVRAVFPLDPPPEQA